MLSSGSLLYILIILKKSTRLVYEAITFATTTKVRNLSRCDPADISTGWGGQTCFHPIGSGSPILFVSTIQVAECHLIEPKFTANSKLQKVLEGCCVEGEWERLVGAIGHIIRAIEYKAQLQAGKLTFGTAYGSGDSCAYQSNLSPFLWLTLHIYASHLVACRHASH
jgi:hypothetical protein